MRYTLCGSTKFRNAFKATEWLLTKAGHIVYTVVVFGHAEGLNHTREDKEMLDAAHLGKIACSDAILVIDVGGYIGESTRKEILFAQRIGKMVKYMRREYPQLDEEEAENA